jgi:hypothetical protein
MSDKYYFFAHSPDDPEVVIVPFSEAKDFEKTHPQWMEIQPSRWAD